LEDVIRVDKRRQTASIEAERADGRSKCTAVLQTGTGFTERASRVTIGQQVRWACVSVTRQSLGQRLILSSVHAGSRLGAHRRRDTI